MERAAPSLESLQALELRVFAGPQRGAGASLRTGAPCVIAAGPDGDTSFADIVLRDDRAGPARIRLHADFPEAVLEVLQGEVKLGGQVLTVGRQVSWNAHAPLTIGSAVVAFGRACIDEWPTATPSSPHALQSSGMATPSPPGAGRAARAGTPWRRRADVWLAATGTAVLLLSSVVVGAAYLQARPSAVEAATLPDDPVARLVRSLRESQFGMLDVTTRGNGQVVVRGRLATEAQRDQLAQWLRDAPLAPAIEVIVDEALVREVAEVFRINGIAVSAQLAGPGRVAAEAAEQDAAALARAEEAVRRDVRGLLALDVRNTAKPAPPPPPPVNDDPGKRIASLVTGSSAYLVTVDGARYFVGAMLPTGHRILRIDRSAVALERDGQRTSLSF
jgi:type III secretion protein D